MCGVFSCHKIGSLFIYSVYVEDILVLLFILFGCTIWLFTKSFPHVVTGIHITLLFAVVRFQYKHLGERNKKELVKCLVNSHLEQVSMYSIKKLIRP